MSASKGFGLRLCALLVGGVLALAVPAGAGTWSSLPNAVDQLQQRPTDRTSLEILRQAESSILTEAAAGHLDTVVALMAAYENLVSPLDDGDRRCNRLRVRIANVLVAYGNSRLPTEPDRASRAYALAAGYHPVDEALDALRELLLPPADAEPGQIWRSPHDGSELVFHPALQFGFGCTFGDNDCMKDEAGRWVQTSGFWIESTEVTNRRYRMCVEAGFCSPPAAGGDDFADPERGDEPVAGVSWRQARSYALWAGRRLPSEVEWERAARGSEPEGRFPWGKGRKRGLANLDGTTDEDPFDGVAPVGSFPATGFGLFDMAGNLWEWCTDSYHRDLNRGPVDERAWARNGWGRVLRGGSWRRTVEVARVSSRDWQEEDYFADDVGFRCVADPPAEVPTRQLVSLGQRDYPIRMTPGLELEAADLTPADRRYLEQTALNWLVLEGRVAEAVTRAVGMLRRNPNDPVARDLLSHLEEEMASDLRSGNVRAVQTALTDYRRAVDGDRRLSRRLEAYERRLLDEVRVNVQWFINRNDEALVVATVGFTEMLNPNDPVLVTLVASIEAAAGSVRVWARDGKEMVRIPGGEFRMGASPDDKQAAYDEHPAHTVMVEGFWLDRTEVTNDEYRQCVHAGVCAPPRRSGTFDDPNLGNLPVMWVDWGQARSYARWAGKRLPTEAEWEWAARTGQADRFPWGDEWQDGAANAMGALGNDRWAGPSPVASFQPNRWGVYDLLGNAAEWVHDPYHQNYWDAPGDARSWGQFNGGLVERQRVVRGGSHIVPWTRLRVSYRDERPPHTFNRGTGFRCAAD